jgi:hypothetical protein
MKTSPKMVSSNLKKKSNAKTSGFRSKKSKGQENFPIEISLKRRRFDFYIGYFKSSQKSWEI